MSLVAAGRKRTSLGDEITGRWFVAKKSIEVRKRWALVRVGYATSGIRHQAGRAPYSDSEVVIVLKRPPLALRKDREYSNIAVIIRGYV